MDNSPITIASVSGGKSSAYMALHYPADAYVFALVCIEDPDCAPKDPAITRYVQERIPWFVASAEHDYTLRNLMLLEQYLGQEIKWVAHGTFEALLRGELRVNLGSQEKTRLPYKGARYCTQILKVLPIFEYTYFTYGVDSIPIMNMGFRASEPDRAKDLDERNDKGFHYSLLHDGKLNRWSDIHWRDLAFPLIEHHVTHNDILAYWDKRDWLWPFTSNCAGCFHKSIALIQEQWKRDPARIQWFADQEQRGMGTWRDDLMTYEQIRRLPPQGNLFETMCNDGFCGV